MGIADAEHQENTPGASVPFISKLQCSLVGVSETVRIHSDSHAYKIYGQSSCEEQFACSFGLNESFREHLESGQLRITGIDNDNNARIVELGGRRFFLATLFLPQFSSLPEAPHPLILEFVKAATEISTLTGANQP